MTIDALLQLLEHVRETGGGYTARCPAHADTNPSLSVKEGRDGAILIRCRVGCSTQDVMAALGLGLADLFPEVRATTRYATIDPATQRRRTIHQRCDCIDIAVSDILDRMPASWRGSFEDEIGRILGAVRIIRRST